MGITTSNQPINQFQKDGKQSTANLDRMIHEPARLMIMAVLSAVDSADFIFVMNQTELSWGNLSAHVAKLEEAGYLSVIKTFKERRPNTTLHLSQKGRNALRQYRRQMEFILDNISE